MTLPLRPSTRTRLRVVRAIDRVGVWLVDHRCMRAAEWMWRACRLW